MARSGCWCEIRPRAPVVVDDQTTPKAVKEKKSTLNFIMLIAFFFVKDDSRRLFIMNVPVSADVVQNSRPGLSEFHCQAHVGQGASSGSFLVRKLT